MRPMTAPSAPVCAVLSITPAEGEGTGATVAFHLLDGVALDAVALVRGTRDAAALCTLAAWFLGEPCDNDPSPAAA